MQTDTGANVRRAVTLIELLVAIACASVVVMVASDVFISANRQLVFRWREMQAADSIYLHRAMARNACRDSLAGIRIVQGPTKWSSCIASFSLR